MKTLSSGTSFSLYATGTPASWSPPLSCPECHSVFVEKERVEARVKTNHGGSLEVEWVHREC